MSNYAPERIYNWLDSHLSIARFSGGCTLNGYDYVIAFHEKGQPLVRSDVLKRERKAKRSAEPTQTNEPLPFPRLE